MVAVITVTLSKILTGLLFPIAWLSFLGGCGFIWVRPRLGLQLFALAVAAFVANWSVAGLAALILWLLSRDEDIAHQ